MKNNCRETFNQERLIGKSNAVEKVKKFINIASQNDYPILILGETGVGKTIVAKWIHKRSRRNYSPKSRQWNKV
ncbi:MAG: sigma 54-interacting transcriptional regulator [Candidatus Aminicenantes bacterium]|nr:sigma 54-interacting transcriptional regulator [Candidatus Aminicenantes bacterium]